MLDVLGAAVVVMVVMLKVVPPPGVQQGAEQEARDAGLVGETSHFVSGLHAVDPISCRVRERA
jgi:hypothetical protein